MDANQPGIDRTKSIKDLHHLRLALSGVPMVWAACYSALRRGDGTPAPCWRCPGIAGWPRVTGGMWSTPSINSWTFLLTLAGGVIRAFRLFPLPLGEG